MHSDSLFKERNKNKISELAAFYRKHLLDDIMPFWDKRVVDTEYGGYYSCFDRKGNLYSDVKSGWFVGRNLYLYSALYQNIEKRPQWLDIAENGRDYMIHKAMESDGRLNRMQARDGSVIDGASSIFTDHFAVKGLFEYIEASGKTEDIPLAKQMANQLFANVTQKEILAKECSDSRFKKHATHFMTLIVAIESKKIFGDAYRSLIDEHLKNSLYTFCDDTNKAPLEYVGVDGKPLYEGVGRLIDPGHTMESLWFAMKEGIERSDKAIITRASEIVDWVIERAWDKDFGGFFHGVDVFSTAPEEPFSVTTYVDTDVKWYDKVWWVQVECLYTLALSAILTNNQKHFDYFLQLHEFCQRYFFDKEYGEWFSILNRDGSVLSDKKGFELKGPYHVPRCIMQLTLLFEQYESQNKKEE